MYHQINSKRCVAFVAWLSLATMILSVFVAVIPVWATSEKTSTQPKTEHTTLPLSALVSHLVDGDLSDAEKAWLDTQASATLTADFTLSYDSQIPHESITLTLDNGTLTVKASPYVGGTFATVWTPTAVTYLDKTYPLIATHDASVYEATLTCEQGVDMAEVSVTYEAKLPLPNVNLSAYETLVNAAYHTADEAMTKLDLYEEDMLQYTAQTQTYVAYQAALRAYLTDMAVYQAYLQAMEDYKAKLSAYETYQAQMIEYQKALEVYENYLTEKAKYDEAYATYMAFLKDPSGYEQTYLAYVTYLNQLDMVNAQVAILDSFFVADSKGNVMNATLNGSTVATVVQNKNELVAAGCNEADINNADKATANLIALLSGYNPKASMADKYAYYIKNYWAYKENVSLLYASLSRLYENDGVPDLLKMQGKLERYWQFVAQLYVLTCALDDTMLLDKTWSISEGKLLLLLEECFLLPDKNQASPMSSYPTPVEEVIPPDEMTKPETPTPVVKPIPPVTVTQPTLPKEVTKPTMPTPVKDPGEPPVLPNVTSLVHDLVDAINEGDLTQRTLTTLPETYPVTQKVSKGVSTADTPVAWFYDADRMALLTSVKANPEGKVAIPQNIPTPPDAVGKHYVFDGFVTQSGEAYERQATTADITQDTVFYATYQTQNIPYTITFLVEGQPQEHTCTYGEMPTYDGIPQKASDDSYAYVFAGWTPAPSPAVEDAVYEAVFVPVVDAYTVTWVIDGREETQVYSRGETPTYPHTPQKSPNGRYAYVFSGWTPSVTPVYDHVTYTAVFKEVDLFPLMPNNAQVDLVTTQDAVYVAMRQALWQSGLLMDVSQLPTLASEGKSLTLTGQDFTMTLSAKDWQTLSEVKATWLNVSFDKDIWQFEVLDKDKKPMQASVQATWTLTLPQGYGGCMYDKSQTLVAEVQTDTTQITYVALSGEAYALYMGQNITPKTVEFGFCTVDRPYAMAGQTVALTAMPQVGYGVSQITVTTKTGEAVELTSQGESVYTFVMPNQAVEITPTFTPLSYTVVFKADGEVLSTQTYTYGQTPTPPTTPQKADDTTNRYTFVGWHKAITPVVGDAVYEAVFVATPIEDVSGVRDSGVGFVELCIMGVVAFVLTTGGVLVPYFIIRAKEKAKVEQGKC